MLKKTAIIIILAALSTVARAGGPYAGAGVNYLNISDAKNAGFSVEAFGGTSFGNALRGELALSLDQAKFRDKNVRMADIFANLYFDFKADSKINPYVLAGIGYGNAATGSFFGSSSRQGKALGQVGAGLGIPVSENVMLDFKYRYQFSGDYKLPNTGSFQLNGHSLGLGFRYLF
jgi:opacity protein-like surface antigen